MERLVKKYADKLVAQGLCDRDKPLVGGLDADLIWNRSDPACKVLEEVVSGLNINSILFARPAEPYFSIFNYLTRSIQDIESAIYPEDSETRTFLHDIPVSREFSAKVIIPALKRRKSIVIPDYGIVTFGIVSPEQAFVTYSSVCFALFVKFFVDYLYAKRKGEINKEMESVYGKAVDFYKNLIQKKKPPFLKQWPFFDKEDIIEAIIQAGKITVDYRMVDSFFGNISYKFNDIIYISQTGSSLDELGGCIDWCPVDSSSCAGITASSEFTAHREIYFKTDNQAILHGHPRFCVIMSLFCENNHCDLRGYCHIKCPQKRFINDIPIVPGEVGTGSYGLYRTLPKAIIGNRGAIVYGHGLFTVGKQDFTQAFTNLLDIERMCFDVYLKN